MLAAAFHDDPFWRWLLHQDSDYPDRLVQAFHVQLEHMALPRGLIHTADGIPGAAVWSPPGTWETNLFRHLRFWPDLIRLVGLTRLPPRLLGIQRVQRVHPSEPHWYLQLLGVDPRHQGSGWARKLLMPVLERCDQDRLPAYLETCNPDNVSLYRRFGFEVVQEVVMAKDGPTAICMLREARATGANEALE